MYMKILLGKTSPNTIPMGIRLKIQVMIQKGRYFGNISTNTIPMGIWLRGFSMIQMRS